jgi:hypothetical protein
MRTSCFAILPACCLLASLAVADEVRYGKIDGVTYQETRRVIRRPIVETKIEQREQTVYRDKYTTDFHPTERRYLTPITEYRWEPQWVNPWNPFSSSYVAYRWMPVTRWVERTEQVRIPVTRRDTVPEKVTMNVPVTTQRFAEDEYVTRVAVSAEPGGAEPARLNADPFEPAAQSPESVARRDTVGGIRELKSDPPRQGEWRAASEYRR